MTTAAVLLAAGGGHRFADGPKLLAPFRGRPLVAAAVGHASAAGLDETVVVVGSVDLGDLLPGWVTVLRNDRWQQGLATSLALAVEHADSVGHNRIVVGLGDQPLVPAAAWAAVAASPSPVAVATYGGRRRNPVGLARSVWPLLPVDGDDGARALVHGHPELVAEVPCDGDPTDVDTAADLYELDGTLPGFDPRPP